MPSLKDLVRAVQQDLPVTLRMERWLIENANPRYSERAIQFSDDFLRGKVGGNRKNRELHFRASGMGKCPRRRVLERIAHKGISEDFSSEQSNTFATGNFMHRKWQMAGLTEGWLTDVEVPVLAPDQDLAGTMDGRIYDNSLFEYKTINSRGYRWVTSQGQANHDHKLQTGAYKILDPSLTAASIVYENKETGEWREYRTYFTDELMDEVYSELEMLRTAVATQKLPPIKPKCIDKEGMEYRRCPFRDSCLKIKDWPKESK